MKKRLLVVATAVMSMAMSMTAFASMGNWQQNETGWWWQRNDGSYPADEWKWIDGNGDGTAESYYFDQNGYLITNTTTPDGYTVNADGAWVQDGVVQKRQVMLDLEMRYWLHRLLHSRQRVVQSWMGRALRRLW